MCGIEQTKEHTTPSLSTTTQTPQPRQRITYRLLAHAKVWDVETGSDFDKGAVEVAQVRAERLSLAVQRGVDQNSTSKHTYDKATVNLVNGRAIVPRLDVLHLNADGASGTDLTQHTQYCSVKGVLLG